MKQDLIRNTPLFADLTAAEQEAICERLYPEQFARGAPIFEQGDPAEHLYLIQSGWVRIVGPEGAALASLGPGSVFGEADVFLGRTRSTSALAVANIEAFVLHSRDLSALLERNPQMGVRLSQAFGGNLAQMESYLAQRLSDLPGFGDLRSDQLAQVVHHLQSQTIAQGRSVFQRGEKSKGLYIIEQGALQIGSGDSFVELMPGQIAGEMALLADKPHTQDARAVEETLLWFLPRNDFSALTTVIPELRTVLSRNLRSTLSAADQTSAVNQLRTMPLFAGVSDEVLRAIARRMLLQHVPARQIIFRQGSAGEALYLVENGDIELTSSLESPDDVLARVGVGGFFGEMSLLTGRPSAVNARAVNETNLWVLYRKDFEELTGQYPALSMAISRALAARLADADERFVDRHLQRLPLFAGLSSQQLDDVASHLTPERFRRGETIFVQGEPGHTLYLIETGRVSLTTVDGGQEYELPTLHSGDFFGERSLLTGDSHTTSVVAQTDVDLWTLGREDFESLVQHYPSLALNISRALTRRLHQSENRPMQVRQAQTTVTASLPVAPAHPLMAPRATAPMPAAPSRRPAPMASAAASQAPAGLFGAIWGLGQSANNLSIWFQSRTTGTKLRLVAVILLFIWLCGIAAPLSLFNAISQRNASLGAANLVALTQRSWRNTVGSSAPALALKSGQTIALAPALPSLPTTPTWTPAPTETLIPTETPLPTATPTETPLPTTTPLPTATPTNTPAPTATARPAPAAARVAPAQQKAAPQSEAPKSGNQYVLKEMRRLTPCENKGNHNIFGLVIDAAGNPIDGITFIQTPGDNPGEVLDKNVSGSKGPGKFEFVMWKGAQYAVFATNDGQSPSGSDIARPMHSNFIDEAECAPGEGGNTLFHNSFAVVFVKTR